MDKLHPVFQLAARRPRGFVPLVWGIVVKKHFNNPSIRLPWSSDQNQPVDRLSPEKAIARSASPIELLPRFLPETGPVQQAGWRHATIALESEVLFRLDVEAVFGR